MSHPGPDPASPRTPRLPAASHAAAPPGARSIRPAPIRAGALIVLALFAGACASDKPTGPPAAVEIMIRDTVFQPAAVVIDRGDVVEWINVSRAHRTVTSGLGPADADAGLRFDVDLAGYKSGEPEGGHYRRTFTESDTVHYFSRLAPDGFPDVIAGVIIVR